MAFHLDHNFEWDGLEYDHREKPPNWSWLIGGVATILAIVSLIFGNFIFALLIIAAGLAIILYGHRRPDEIIFVVNRHGVKIKNVLYPFAHLHSFWIHEEEAPEVPGRPRRHLSLRSEKTFVPHIVIPLPPYEQLNHQEVREFLMEFLPEERHEKTFADWLMEYLGL